MNSEYQVDLDEFSGQFKKVVFLDIDGVLNDEGEKVAQGIYVEEERVQRLAKIIENTGADVILTSSWRINYQRFIRSGYQDGDEKLVMLQAYFDQYGIKVKGMTDSIDSGPDARPAEIRQWLADKPDTERFVILDDDTFWSWNWLSEFVVLTRREPNSKFSDWLRGIEDEHVEKAIAILNDL